MTNITQEIKLAFEQQARENQARIDGMMRYRETQAAAISSGELARTTSAKALNNAAFGRVTESIQRMFDTAAPAAKASLTWGIELGAAKCAHIALQYAWNGVGKARTAVATRIGAIIEKELNAIALKKGHPGLAAYVFDQIKKSRSPRHKAAVMAFAQRQTGTPTLEEMGVDKALMSQLGMKLLDTVIESSGLFEYASLTSRLGASIQTELTVVLTGDSLDAMKRIDARAEWQKPVMPLMVTKPAPWDENLSGGYISEDMKMDLLKGASLGYLESLEEYDLSPALSAMNILQSTPFRVNAKVLAVMNEVWEKDWNIGVMPKKEPRAVPAMPVKLDNTMSDDERTAAIEAFKATNPEAWKTWKKAASEAKAWNASAERATKIQDVDNLLSLANEHAGYDAFYSPVQMDFRTRLYYVANLLTPQGNDLAKGLLEFTNGVAMTEQGARSLAIAGATMWANGGLDKMPMEDRVNWVYENDGIIRACARDPMSNLFWADADGGATAWTFLAFCFEWAAWREHGEGYVSHLIIYADGKCNGSQHHSALMRAEEEAQFVCMTPMVKPDDLYTRVLDKVNARIEAGLHDDTPVKKDDANSPTRGQLFSLVYGKLKRAHVKRACMTYSYGVTPMGVRDQLKADHAEFFKQFDKSIRKPLITLLAGEIMTAVKDTVKASATCMRFLQDVARVVAEAGLPINWVTPDGFAVEQKYEKFDAYVVNTTISGGVRARIDKTDEVRRHFFEACFDTAKKVIGTKAGAQRFLDELHGMVSYGVVKNIMDGYRALLLAEVEDRAASLRESIRKELGDVLVGNYKAMLEDLVVVFEDLVTKSFEMKTTSSGRMQATMLKPSGELDVNKQASAMAPNFIHSMDATALRMTLNACAEVGITDFAAVHDSYGTHVENYAEMNRILREQFVKMYTETDPLADLLAMAKHSLTEEEAAKLPDLPKRGNLDLELVKDAEFFFA